MEISETRQKLNQNNSTKADTNEGKLRFYHANFHKINCWCILHLEHCNLFIILMITEYSLFKTVWFN